MSIETEGRPARDEAPANLPDSQTGVALPRGELWSCAIARRRWVIALVVGSLLACGAAGGFLWWSADPNSFLRYEIFERSSGEEARYTIYVPKNYDAAKSYPMIVFLHGWGKRGTDGHHQVIDGIAVAILHFLKHNEPFDFIVLFPQKLSGHWSPGSDDTNLVMELVDHTIKRFSVDQERVSLTGICSGGTGTWDLAVAYPDRWAAIMPMRSFATPELAPNVKHIPCWCFQGSRDSIEPVRETIKSIKDLGGNARLTEVEGNEAWIPGYIKRDLYEWLSAQRRRQ